MIYPIFPRSEFGKDYLAYWEGFLTDEDIKIILGLQEWNNTDKAYVGGVLGGTGVLDEKVRRTELAWMPKNELTLPIYDKLANIIAEINRRFFHFELTGIHEPAQLGCYSAKEKGHYGWHIDGSDSEISMVPRKLSMVLMLSDAEDYQGGELQIKNNTNEEKTLETKKGRAWFFPSWTLHRVTPVEVGIRKSLVVWAGGPSFK